MSAPTTKAQILFEQRVLACGGFYKGNIDGLWGPKSNAAAVAAENNYLAIRQNIGTCDPRSEKAIATLLPEMQKKARKIWLAANAWGKQMTLLNKPQIAVQILSGTRSYAEQDALFAKRPKVTNARGGQSNHNFGIAIDLGLFENMKYLTGSNKREEELYANLGAALKDAIPGIEWGGDWKSFPDMPHYEFATGLSIAQKRAKFEAGKLVL